MVRVRSPRRWLRRLRSNRLETPAAKAGSRPQRAGPAPAPAHQVSRRAQSALLNQRGYGRARWLRRLRSNRLETPAAKAGSRPSEQVQPQPRLTRFRDGRRAPPQPAAHGPALERGAQQPSRNPRSKAGSRPREQVQPQPAHQVSRRAQSALLNQRAHGPRTASANSLLPANRGARPRAKFPPGQRLPRCRSVQRDDAAGEVAPLRALPAGLGDQVRQALLVGPGADRLGEVDVGVR